MTPARGRPGEDPFQKDVQACGDAGSKDYIFSFAGGEMKKFQKLFSCIKDLFFQRVGVAVSPRFTFTAEPDR